jgi:serine-type D-Ala-D-Ala carboxypeptidase (penicillin-binding protein 5/6)
MKKKSSNIQNNILLIWVHIFLLGILLLVPGEADREIRQEVMGQEVLAERDIELNIALYPRKISTNPDPLLRATAALVMDVDSAVILYEKNIQERLYPASTTKMMTALVAIEKFPIDQVATVPNIYIPPHKINLRPAEKITIENLIYGTLISSGNDAAETIAANFPGGREEFIKEMNKKAEELNLMNTKFQNPTGLDAPNHYSTALDLARIAVYALRDNLFSNIVATQKTSIFSIDGKYEHKLQNINQLLGTMDGVKGVKTGYTEGAGESLVALTERDGKRILTVVLGSDDRFGETRELVEWAFASHQWFLVKID